jgi:hypothetical protein
LKKNTDIGYIINSKLKSKYNDDFFDESKGWEALMNNLPKKGFWNWGTTHINIYYVTLMVLITALYCVYNYTNTSNKAPLLPKNSIIVNPKPNQEAESTESKLLFQKKTYGEATVEKTQNESDLIDSVHNDRGLNPITDPVLIKDTSHGISTNQLINTENHTEPTVKKPEIILSSKLAINDSLPKPTIKRDTIRKRIKRFD